MCVRVCRSLLTDRYLYTYIHIDRTTNTIINQGVLFWKLARFSVLFSVWLPVWYDLLCSAWQSRLRLAEKIGQTPKWVLQSTRQPRYSAPLHQALWTVRLDYIGTSGNWLRSTAIRGTTASSVFSPWLPTIPERDVTVPLNLPCVHLSVCRLVHSDGSLFDLSVGASQLPPEDEKPGGQKERQDVADDKWIKVEVVTEEEEEEEYPSVFDRETLSDNLTGNHSASSSSSSSFMTE